LTESSGGLVSRNGEKHIGREAAEQVARRVSYRARRSGGSGVRPRGAAWMPQTSVARQLLGTARNGTPVRDVQRRAEREDRQGCRMVQVGKNEFRCTA
jgi:hypothetical protein